MFTLEEQIKQVAIEYKKEATIKPLPVSEFSEFINTGERISFEASYFSRRKQLAVLALAFFMGEDTKEMLEQVIWEVCNEFTWSLPAHLTIVGDHYGEDSSEMIDLFAAETGQTLAEINHLVGDKLSPIVVSRINTEIERRLLIPFEERIWEWERKENNWSAVIAGSLGLVLLYQLSKNSKRQLHLLDRVDKALSFYLKSFGDDGACEEGIGYWAYGFGYYVYFAEKYLEIFDDNKYLKDEKIKRIAEFPSFVMIDEENGIPFSDYFPAELPSGLMTFCKEYFDIKTTSITKASDLDFDDCYRFAPLYRNLSWTKKLEGEALEVTRYFSNVEWAVNITENDYVFAAKGGRNNESHNHIDLGHFVFGTKEELFLTDLGAGEYTKDYFNESVRYKYLVANALGHSLPIVNDCYQLPGDIYAKNTSFESKGKSIFKTELAQTYSADAYLERLTRELDFSKESGSLTLTDSYEMKKEASKVVESFVTTYPVSVESNKVIIQGKQQCELIFGEDVSSIKLLEEEYHKHDGSFAVATIIQATFLISQKEKVIEIQINIK